MNIVSGLVVFVMIWWVVFFCTLPFGVPHEQQDKAPHIGPGAPPVPLIGKKIIITTAVSVLLWVVAYFLIDANFVNFREMAEE